MTDSLRDDELPMAAQNTKMAKDGTVASSVARIRNAAQSASTASTPTPHAANSTKPWVAAAGAVTWWKSTVASWNARAASCQLCSSGNPKVVEPGKTVHDTS